MKPTRLKHFVCISVSFLLAAGCQNQVVNDPNVHAQSVERTRRTVTYLASDKLEGRGAGTKGLDVAADFLSSEMLAIGLRPARGADAYFQHYSIRGDASIDKKSSLRIAGIDLELDKDFRPSSISKAGDFSGPITFAGYSITSTEPVYNDFDGLDVKNRIVLALRFEPHDDKGKSRFAGKDEDWSDASALATKADAAAKAGAAALLVVTPPTHHGTEDTLSAFGRRSTRNIAAIPVIQITRAAADRLLAAGGLKDLVSLQSTIDGDFKPASAQFDDGLKAEGKVEILQPMIPVKNVLGILPGSGPKADEYIVVGAHYDHLGWGGSGSLAGPTTRAIHNGADDNASGTSAVLELARRLATHRKPLERSVLFIFFSGEERGLLGSEYFVNNPLVPLDKIVAMYNLDMVGRVKNEEMAVGGRETAAAFSQLMDDADAKSPLKFTKMSRSTFGSSDHASFMTKKIPVLFLFSGLHSDYHRPTDDVEKINFEGIAQAVDVSEDVVTRLASMPRQAYLAPATRPASTGPTSGPTTQRGGRPQLGIIPSYSEDETGPEGVKITGTTPGTAAADAGLKDGDVIQAINGRKMRTLEDLMAFLDGANIGEKVTLHVLRGKEVKDFETTLRGRQAD